MTSPIMSPELDAIDASLLDAQFLGMLVGFLGACRAHGLRLRATMGYRSTALQAQLYANRQPGQAVAPPGHSKHEEGKACDFLAYDSSGDKIDSSDAQEYRTMEELAPRYGLRTGRSWSKPDGGHVEEDT